MIINVRYKIFTNFVTSSKRSVYTATAEGILYFGEPLCGSGDTEEEAINNFKEEYNKFVKKIDVDEFEIKYV